MWCNDLTCYAWLNSAWYRVLWCGVVWHWVFRCGVMRHCVARCGIVCCIILGNYVTSCSVTRLSIVRRDTLLDSLGSIVIVTTYRQLKCRERHQHRGERGSGTGQGHCWHLHSWSQKVCIVTEVSSVMFSRLTGRFCVLLIKNYKWYALEVCLTYRPCLVRLNQHSTSHAMPSNWFNVLSPYLLPSLLSSVCLYFGFDGLPPIVQPCLILNGDKEVRS